MPSFSAATFIGGGVRTCFRPTGLSGCVMTSFTEYLESAASALRLGTANAEVPRKTIEVLMSRALSYSFSLLSAAQTAIKRYTFSVSHRNAQIAGIIRSTVARYALKIQPQAAKVVSIVEVKLSKDFSYADISVNAIEGMDNAIKFLLAHKGELRKELAEQLRLHKIPVLRFHRDELGEQGTRIDNLLTKLDEEREARQAPSITEVIKKLTAKKSTKKVARSKK